MTPDEFLFTLKNLPPDTPMTAQHVIAVLETMKNAGGNGDVDFDKLSNTQVIDEETLSKWIGESVSTLQKWRVTGKGPQATKKPKNIGYQVGHVRDWLKHITVSSTAESKTRLNRFEGEFFNPVPYMLNHASEPVEFFESLESEEELQGFGLEWVQYYSLPQENLSAWLYQNLGKIPLSDLAKQIEEFVEFGADINQKALIVRNEELSEISIADLLAEYDGCDSGFGDLVISTMDKGLNVDGLLLTGDQFSHALNSYQLHKKLSNTLK